ncbi:hypothetical protein BD289DRAFT_1670 [Coniella lustricola]|uniref:Xylanolytic transcriptional activator regulatory domain-containing protein n=1 Tax=Coniella lustricola TaxID=2025994 RepID=A0A2T3ANM1_9PEZI|nr:hypothetical protein BD289DRAFT_1670 [Coniella lustricola]
MTTSKTLGKSIKAARVPRLLTLDFGNHIPSREVADELLDGYLRTFETVYRVLHVPTFRQEYEKYWQNPQGAREVFVIQLQLCMALGAVLRDEKFSLRKLALRWIYEARLWLLQPSEKSRVNLSGMQVWCLVHLSRDLCGVGSDLVWVSAGTMMRMALYIGLHRDPDRLPAMSLLAAESRRRLWATILEILVQSSMESGGPPLISSDDYDCKPPGNYNDEDLVSDTTSPAPLPKPATTFTDSSVQIALLSSTHIRLQIAAYLNSFRSTPSYDKTLDLNSDLTAASRSLDALLRIYQTQSPGVSSFQLSVAEHITQRYFFALHLPWLGFAKDDPRYFFSRKVTVEIAMRNQRKSKAHGSLGSESGRDAPKPDDFGRLLICGTGGYRYVGTQCMLVLTLELIWNLEEQRCALRSVTAGEPASAPACATRPRGIIGLGFGILGAQSDINEEMVEMLNDAATWLRARIKAGEINIKGYLFGKCMLAEIEGLQDGADEEELRRRLRQCATDAAVECLDHLKELSAAEAAQVGMGMTGSAPQATGMGSVAVPRYTGMDGSAVPGPGDGNVYESMDTGTTGTMTDWDWDVFQDPNYNFSLNLNLGGMDLIFGS